MDVGLRLRDEKLFGGGTPGLNPCCNGCWSPTEYKNVGASVFNSLNPCCNGCWSPTPTKAKDGNLPERVLILVVMDVGLRPAVRQPES